VLVLVVLVVLVALALELTSLLLLLLLSGIIGGFGYAAYKYWHAGNYLMFSLCFWCYCTFYTSSADSRWHECGAKDSCWLL